jgi:pimeloyl-ACP methyl ester carboxylesterase
MTLTARVQAWQAEGEHVIALGRHRIFMVRRRGEGPTLVLLHGFPSCSYDWRALLEQDALRGRDVLAFDFLRFGLSEKPLGRNSLLIQADIVEELVGRYTDGHAFLVAHDMGTSVANELFAREIEGRPAFEITGALLFNGSMLLHLAHLTPGQKLLMSKAGPVLAQLSTERFFRQQFGSVFSAAHPLTSEEAADQWSLMSYNRGQRRGHDLIAYQEERVRYAERWHGAIRDWPGRLSLLWAMLDPVAGPEMLQGVQQLRPGVPVTELPTLGHYPQIEDPAAVADVLTRAAATRPS